MRLLFVNTLYPPNVRGGAERSTAILAESLAARGHEVHVVSTAEEDGRQSIHAVTAHYWKTPNLYWGPTASQQVPVLKPLWHLIDSHNTAAARRFRKLLQSLRPDIVHTNNLSGFSPAIWKAAADASIPIVHTIRDYYLLCARSTMYREGVTCGTICTRCRVYSRIKRRYTDCVTAVVGISDFVLDRHRQDGFFRSTPLSRRIFNPIPWRSTRVTIRKPGEKLKVGFMGKIAPHKGIEQMLEELSSDAPQPIEINVFGSADRQEYLQALRERFVRLSPVFHGFKDTAQALANIDVLVVPSQFNEPFGRVVVEANACGVPAIVSNRGGLPEIIEKNRNGRVFDPDRSGELRQALQAIAGDRKVLATYREQCLESAEKYRPEVIASQYVNVYEEVLS